MNLSKAAKFLTITSVCASASLYESVNVTEITQLRHSKKSKGSKGSDCTPGIVIVANRGSGNICILSDDGNQVEIDLPIPHGSDGTEPMYVMAANGRIYVGDRKNDRIAVLDAETYEWIDSISTGKGVFHMGFDGKRTWVVNDIDLTMTVVDLIFAVPIKTVELPHRIRSDGGKPHDCTMTPDGATIFVSILYPGQTKGEILRYDAQTYELTNSITVAGDPHLATTFLKNIVFSPQQGGSVTSFLDQDDLSEIGSIHIPNAHGIGIDPSGSFTYVTNIGADVGTGALYTIDNRKLELVGNPVPVPYKTPHNVAVTPDRRLFLTHSGPTANKVTEYIIDEDNIPVFSDDYTVGTNPFGIFYLKGTCLN